MNIFLIYLLKVNIALSIIFVLYFLILRNNTLFKSKRFFLWTICAFTLIYPFISIQMGSHEPLLHEINYHFIEDNLYLDDASTLIVGKEVTPKINLSQIAFFLYLTVTLILSVRFIIQYFGLIKLIRRGRFVQLMGHNVTILPQKTAPFSFFSRIVIDQETSQENGLQEILTHEQTHVNQKHSIDVIFSEIYTIFCWFNPLTWLLRKEIRLNLEYLADASVIRSGYDAEQYQFHILRLSYPLAIAKLHTGFNFSPLKKRIKMMNTKKSPAKAYIKYMLFIPVVAALLLLNQKKMEAMPAIPDALVTPIENLITEVTVQTPAKTTQEPAKTTQNRRVVKSDVDKNGVYDYVEKMPAFPGGDAEFIKFVQSNLVYPIEAHKEGIQGTVRLRFVIQKDGLIGEIKIDRSLFPACDEAAIEAIKKSPKWIPGELEGQAVDVWYSIPVKFELTGGDGKAETVKTTAVDVNKDGVYEFVEKMPAFPGGDTEFLKLVQSNLIYPIEAQKKGIKGIVRLRFVIKKDGSIGEIKIDRSLSPECDEAAVEAIKKSPKWIPGEQKGQAVDVWYSIPVRFELHDNNKPTEKPEPNEIIIINYDAKK